MRRRSLRRERGRKCLRLFSSSLGELRDNLRIVIDEDTMQELLCALAVLFVDEVVNASLFGSVYDGGDIDAEC